ncbi:autotransporter outer membrane beta-barrel domain-containing protein [Hoeflea prorocentri]|uniref:Autotransporter outer membrane beta-barrel domain-containing protein n=1 Tax=Hoeflea prorocentri TaxID=1922333 RepID=A0A9X3ZI24_9HYPH|nr:autotransporter outer membrane beta-barrel domain-containing protein [Hoeflea prorocentri]MCY6381421.1 autotransporter outer membrane beta-barrel domain-containing protein [Hoeflea prorocentri]MDA5399221.1 autotransporter outer membrane beta-barrel domain-containing protein [Hoeflea prorocentri]
MVARSLPCEHGQRPLIRSLVRGAVGGFFVAAITLVHLPVANADCSTADSTFTCTGNFSSGLSLGLTNETQVTIQDLNTDAGAIAIVAGGADGTGTGDAGGDTTAFDIDFDGSNAYGINATSAGDTALSVTLTGGNGAIGKEKTGNADSGGDGGSTGAVSLTVTNTTTVTGVAALVFTSDGGDGGTGGKGKNAAFNSGRGGTGGAGGSAGGITVKIDSGELANLTSTAGSIVSVLLQGGDGGEGGEGAGQGGSSTNIHGGNGGDGGVSGNIDVRIHSTVSGATIANSTPAVFLETLGGAGGKGGKGSGTDLSHVTGGNGGKGGSAGTITFIMDAATITTSGETASGLFARSYGGAGGNGGDAGGGASGSGGSAKGAGNGDDVSVTITANITTTGRDADGILIQSVGGFAGDGGSAAEVLDSYGAASESAGTAGTAGLTLGSGSIIQTSGEGAAGVFVQSVGGGGGKGGSGEAFASLGGSGSAGGDADSVTIVFDSNVTVKTAGIKAPAVVAQSMGGGGGSGGSSDGVEALGGSGGSGGAGKDVTVTLDGSKISSDGVFSDALVLQSIGGGGGIGGSVETFNLDVGFSTGGTGGTAGNGGTVTLKSASTTVGSVEALGYRSHGVLLQSIGGGGGNSSNDLTLAAGIGVDINLGQGGNAGSGGAGDTVTAVQNYFTVKTQEDLSHGFVAQSIGGGGGMSGSTINYDAIDAGVSFTQTVGGSAGDGGAGGAVKVVLFESVTTGGVHSPAVVAHSVGGGGGIAGSTFGGSGLTFGSVDNTVGGSGGRGGDGGTVTLTTNSDMTTTGLVSHAIVAQSIGGGGGMGGWTSTIDVASSGNIELTSGGNSGTGGSGGNVTVNQQGDASVIHASGNNSSAIVAHSIGGGGGMSDMTLTGDLASVGEVSITAGGSGGGAGNAGAVLVTTAGQIIVDGDNGIGVTAQSIAGSGGTSSFSINADLFNGGSYSQTVSGNGGTGGMAATVEIDNEADITTSGDNGTALLAQSVGGGGGNALGVISVEAMTVGEVSMALGGDGGASGSGGAVTVTNGASLATTGEYAYGIMAQSVGGEGGSAWLAVDAGLSAGEYTADIDVTLGGTGGSGSKGGTVNVNNGGAISTQDFSAVGLLAQSVGGAGGSGGTALSGVMSFSSNSSLTVDVGIGGEGGGGGAGGDVSVVNLGSITTGRFYSSAVLAQSIGGNGGSGGSSFVFASDSSTSGTLGATVTVGGAAGNGGIGGDVDVFNLASLSTTRGGSKGIYAQSIGGNGGQGGTAANILLDFTSASASSVEVSAAVSVGGKGGTGANAGGVTVNNFGSITTGGDVSSAIFAQSVGGGGGDGGSAESFPLLQFFSSASDGASTGSYSLTFDLGGNGGVGGTGGAVDVTNVADISTSGVASYGIFAHSVGGGGGSGGNGEYAANDFADALTEALESQTGDPQDIFEEYIYAGIDDALSAYYWYLAIQGLSGFKIKSELTNWVIDIGGYGGAAGDGGDLTVDNFRTITTTGASGTAIFAQSVGGGGGVGGDGAAGSISQVTVGGRGSGGGNGGHILIDNRGAINTSGLGAMGMFVQSVGGGGGAAGDVELSFGSPVYTASFGLGVVAQEDSGAGGNGGNIDISSIAAITTSGQFAHGIWAQSTGGSGGAVGVTANTPNTYIGNVGDPGSGGTINIETVDAITMTGDYSTGIFAQSLGGSGDDGGAITLDIHGDIISSGTQGYGIVAQSDGYNSAGNVTINIGRLSTVSTGGTANNGYQAIDILGADTATINNEGTISTAQAFASSSDYSTVITMKGDKNTINNRGTISGGLAMKGGSTNLFDNKDGGVFEMGYTVDLSSSGNLVNAGTLSPGGTGNIITTSLKGKLSSQFHSDGIYLFDLEMGRRSDGKSDEILLANSSGSQTPKATVSANPTGTNLLNSGDSGSSTIIYSDDVTLSIKNLAAADTATVDYSLVLKNSKTIDLEYTVDYSSDDLALSQNQQKAAALIEELIAARNAELSGGSVATTSLLGSGDDASAVPLASDVALASVADNYEFVEDAASIILGLATVEELKGAYDKLAPGDVFAAVDAAYFSAFGFSGALNACAGGQNIATADLGAHGTCAWLSIGASHHHRDKNPDAVGYNENVFAIAGGLEYEFTPGWFAGLGLGYEFFNQSSSTFSSNGGRVQLGGSLRAEIGKTSISGSVLGGYGHYDFTREAFSSSGGVFANSNPNLWWVSGQATIGHEFAVTDTSSIKPSFGVGVTHYYQGGFTEAEGGDFKLAIGSISGTVFNFNPAVDISTEFDLSGSTAKATFHLGMLALSGGQNRSTTAQLQAAGFGSSSYTLVDEADSMFADIGASIETHFGERAMFEAGVGALFSADVQEFGGQARLKIPF